MYAVASQPGVLMMGAAVALVTLLWLLFGGSAAPDVSNQDGAGTRLQASDGEQGADGVDPAGGSIPRGAETVPDAATTASDSDAVPSAPSPGDGVAPNSLPSSDGLTTAVSGTSPVPAAAQPDAPPLSAVPTSSVVAAAGICSRLDTRAADGAPLAEWQCQAVIDRAAPGRLFFYTRIRSRTSTTVEHRWLRDGVLEQQVALDVGANDGPGYRTYSSHTVSPDERGTWRVELRLGDQEPLHVQEFVVP